MVNAQKHRELANDWPTRARKKIMRQQLRSKSAQKKEDYTNKLLWDSGGVAGRRSIVETNQKRDKANKRFIKAMSKSNGMEVV